LQDKAKFKKRSDVELGKKEICRCIAKIKEKLAFIAIIGFRFTSA
jgi:hypothetical protein